MGVLHGCPLLTSEDMKTSVLCWETLLLVDWLVFVCQLDTSWNYQRGRSLG